MPLHPLDFISCFCVIGMGLIDTFEGEEPHSTTAATISTASFVQLCQTITAIAADLNAT